MSSTRKIFLFVALPLVVIFAAVIIWTVKDREAATNSGGADSGQEVVKPDAIKVEFTAQIFDPTLISHITPLGELNGGGSEWQAVNGIVIWNKPEVVVDNKMVDVFAPANMTLEAYSYHRDPRGDNIDWTLIFRIDKNVTLKYDHITKAVDKIVSATTSTPSDRSNEEAPKSKVSFKTGELVAQTHGTIQAKNWNIYMTDKAVTNKFVNQARYEKSQIGYRFINGACPFNYYDEIIKVAYLALMGATKAGQSKDCGNPSSDVAGTLSGAWFFDEASDKTTEQIDGNFVSPLAVYLDSANRVIIDQITNSQFRVEDGTDPATVKSEQCYKLVDSNGRGGGYAFFKLFSPTSMKLAYGESGSCPTEFPESGSKTYFR